MQTNGKMKIVFKLPSLIPQYFNWEIEFICKVPKRSYGHTPSSSQDHTEWLKMSLNYTIITKPPKTTVNINYRRWMTIVLLSRIPCLAPLKTAIGQELASLIRTLHLNIRVHRHECAKFSVYRKSFECYSSTLRCNAPRTDLTTI